MSYGPERSIQTGVGALDVRRPKARDRAAGPDDEKVRFTSNILPKWARRSRSLDALLAEARERAEAVLEIDARAEKGGPAALCPRCGCGERVCWARTRTNAQRWRCSGCWATQSGRSGTSLASVYRPDRMSALARDMMEAPQLLSCRRAAETLGASRDTIWRWRMAIIAYWPLSSTTPFRASWKPTRPTSARAARARGSGFGTGGILKTI